MRFFLDTMTQNAVHFMNNEKKSVMYEQITQDSARNVTVWNLGIFPDVLFLNCADPSGQALGLKLSTWGCRFEHRRRHRSVSVVSVVSLQLEVSVTGWSIVQRSPTECGVSEWDDGS